MTRWDVIPVSHQKPGRLAGGVWVVIQAWSVANQWTIALLGEGGATVTAGYGDWPVTQVPRSVGITEWRGENNMEMDVDLMFDGWLAHPIIPQLRKSFETPPKLPTGIKFQNRATGRPVGSTIASKTKRPRAAASHGTKIHVPPPPAHPQRPRNLAAGRAHGLPAPQQRKPLAVSRNFALPPPHPRQPAPIHRRSSARPQGMWMEASIQTLESLALRQDGDDSPHSVRLYGAVPHADKRWVIQTLTWGDAIRDEMTGRRMRQQVTVHLIEFYQPHALKTLPRGKAAKDHATRKRTAKNKKK